MATTNRLRTIGKFVNEDGEYGARQAAMLQAEVLAELLALNSPALTLTAMPPKGLLELTPWGNRLRPLDAKALPEWYRDFFGSISGDFLELPAKLLRLNGKPFGAMLEVYPGDVDLDSFRKWLLPLGLALRHPPQIRASIMALGVGWLLVILPLWEASSWRWSADIIGYVPPQNTPAS